MYINILLLSSNLPNMKGANFKLTSLCPLKHCNLCTTKQPSCQMLVSSE